MRVMGYECRTWEEEESDNKRIKYVIIMTKNIMKLLMIILRNCFSLKILKYF